MVIYSATVVCDVNQISWNPAKMYTGQSEVCSCTNELEIMKEQTIQNYNFLMSCSRALFKFLFLDLAY